jgi:hypothetical protein
LVLLLDTNVFLWFASRPEDLEKEAFLAIEDSVNDVFIPRDPDRAPPGDHARQQPVGAEDVATDATREAPMTYALDGTRGRPPFAPFARAARAFAVVERLPPTVPSWARTALPKKLG